VGVLEISINEHEIFSSVPDCGTPRPLEFSSAHLITGENTLAFKTDRGRYLIDQVRVTTRLKETPSFTFFFDIDEDDYEDIKDENKVANLTFFFTDDEEDKEAVIYVNSRKISMTRHDDITWSANLKSYVEEGSNSLKIVPETKLEVRKLQLRLHD
jgi:hypothetical protein